MFYVSSYDKCSDIVGVTDTSDNTTEYYRRDSLNTLYSKIKVDIYGVDYYNHQIIPTPLEIDKSLSEKHLVELLSAWRELHNDSRGVLVEDYLASAQIGTKITVEFQTTPEESKRVINCSYVIRRLDYDNWLFEKTKKNTASGRTGSSRFAAWVLEVASVYSKLQGLTITRG